MSLFFPVMSRQVPIDYRFFRFSRENSCVIFTMDKAQGQQKARGRVHFLLQNYTTLKLFTGDGLSIMMQDPYWRRGLSMQVLNMISWLGRI